MAISLPTKPLAGQELVCGLALYAGFGTFELYSDEPNEAYRAPAIYRNDNRSTRFSTEMGGPG